MASDSFLMTDSDHGHFIYDFLDLDQLERRRGVYIFHLGEPAYFTDIEDLGYTYNVLVNPTQERPGRVAIEIPGLSASEIFSTTHASLATYVCQRRDGGSTYEASLLLGMAQPGRHFVLHGPSKLGKTALWKATLGSDVLPIPCDSSLSTTSLYTHALYRLQKPFLIGETETESTAQGKRGLAELELGKKDILRAKVLAERDREELVKREREFAFREPPTSPTVLACELAKSGKALVLENYHRLNDKTMADLAVDLRTFSDEGCTVILVGIPEQPYALFGLNRELSGRVDYFEFSPWPVDELIRIARAGQEPLRIVFDDDTLTFLGREAAGSPLLMQQFCLLACLASGVTESLDEIEEVAITEVQFRQAMKKWLINTLAPYSEQVDRIDVAIRQAGLNSITTDIIAAKIRENLNAEIALELLGLNAQDYGAIQQMTSILNADEWTRDAIALKSKANSLYICDPWLFVYLRWLK